MILTKEQRKALFNIWSRGSNLTYKQFRRTAERGFWLDDAVVIPWNGMWLAIETDGYIHS